MGIISYVDEYEDYIWMICIWNIYGILGIWMNIRMYIYICETYIQIWKTWMTWMKDDEYND